MDKTPPNFRRNTSCSMCIYIECIPNIDKNTIKNRCKKYNYNLFEYQFSNCVCDSFSIEHPNNNEQMFYLGYPPHNRKPNRIKPIGIRSGEETMFRHSGITRERIGAFEYHDFNMQRSEKFDTLVRELLTTVPDCHYCPLFYKCESAKIVICDLIRDALAKLDEMVEGIK